MNRRQLLKALGIGGAATLLPVGLGRRASADPLVAPRRVVFLTTQHGAPDYAPEGAPHYWKLGLPGVPADADGERSLSELDEDELSFVLQPLHRHRQKLTVVEGLCMMSAMLDRQGNNHGVSWAHLLTCAAAEYDEPYRDTGGIHPYAKAQSIDQYIASRVAEPGMLPSVEWGTGGRGSGGSGLVGFSTSADGTWLPLQNDPREAFDRVFPGGGVASPEPTEPSRPRTRRELIEGRRTDAIAFAAQQFERTMGGRGLSSADRDRLQAHLDRLRDLERRLQPGVADPTRSCDPSLDTNGDRADQLFRLLALTFGCDRTRVAALNLGELRNAEFTDVPGNVHQDFAHEATPFGHRQMARYYSRHSTQVARLLDELDSVIEPDGSTVLDNTMVIWLTELGTGQHDLQDGLTVVAGGGAGDLSPGRYMRFAPTRTAPCNFYGCRRGNGVGLAQSHLFVSAMQFMGLPDDSFGMASGRDLEGGNIDLTGPIPGL